MSLRERLKKLDGYLWASICFLGKAIHSMFIKDERPAEPANDPTAEAPVAASSHVQQARPAHVVNPVLKVVPVSQSVTPSQPRFSIDQIFVVGFALGPAAGSAAPSSRSHSLSETILLTCLFLAIGSTIWAFRALGWLKTGWVLAIGELAAGAGYRKGLRATLSATLAWARRWRPLDQLCERLKSARTWVIGAFHLLPTR